MNIHDPQTIKDDVGTINFISSQFGVTQLSIVMIRDELEHCFSIQVSLQVFLPLYRNHC